MRACVCVCDVRGRLRRYYYRPVYRLYVHDLFVGHDLAKRGVLTHAGEIRAMEMTAFIIIANNYWPGPSAMKPITARFSGIPVFSTG